MFIKNGFQSRRGLFTLVAGFVLLAGAATARAADNPKVTMTVENRGTLVIELYQKEAPKTVAHFLALINRKFYDGILFHRVIANFVDQVGDPKTKTIDSSKAHSMSVEDFQSMGIGNGGSGPNGANVNIPFEDSGHLNEAGTLAMALTAPASATADSQFYINLKHNTNLDAQYCVFGKVIKGMDLITKIQQGDKIKSFRVSGMAKSSKDKPKK